jgi:hypothetical protein
MRHESGREGRGLERPTRTQIRADVGGELPRRELVAGQERKAALDRTDRTW